MVVQHNKQSASKAAYRASPAPMLSCQPSTDTASTEKFSRPLILLRRNMIHPTHHPLTPRSHINERSPLPLGAQAPTQSIPPASRSHPAHGPCPLVAQTKQHSLPPLDTHARHPAMKAARSTSQDRNAPTPSRKESHRNTKQPQTAIHIWKTEHLIKEPILLYRFTTDPMSMP
jgi:hypothetical protein